jgi:hypothetical protein
VNAPDGSTSEIELEASVRKADNPLNHSILGADWLYAVRPRFVYGRGKDKKKKSKSKAEKKKKELPPRRPANSSNASSRRGSELTLPQVALPFRDSPQSSARASVKKVKALGRKSAVKRR